jgi:hypothetical protein
VSQRRIALTRKLTFTERMIGLMPRDASDLDMIKGQLEGHLKRVEFLSKVGGWTAFSVAVGKYGQEHNLPILDFLSITVFVFAFFALFIWIITQFTYPPDMTGNRLMWRFQRNRAISLFVSAAIFGALSFAKVKNSTPSHMLASIDALAVAKLRC